MSDCEGVSSMRFFAAPLVGLIATIGAGMGWLITLQSEVSKIGARQEDVIREQIRHDGQIQGCQARTSRIEVIESELNHIKAGFEEHRKLTEVKK